MEEKFLLPRTMEPRPSQTIQRVNFDRLDALQQQYRDIGVELVEEEGVSEPYTGYASNNKPLGSLKLNQITKTSVECLEKLAVSLPEIGTHGCYINSMCDPIHTEMIKELGKGSYGNVVLNRNRCTSETFVTKKIRKDKFHVNEVIIPVHFDHKNIVKILGLTQRQFTDGIWLELYMEDAGIYIHP